MADVEELTESLVQCTTDDHYDLTKIGLSSPGFKRISRDKHYASCNDIHKGHGVILLDKDLKAGGDESSSYDSDDDDDNDDEPLFAPPQGKYGWRKFLRAQKEYSLRFYFVGLRLDLYMSEPAQDRYKSLKAKGVIALPQIIRDEYDKKYGSYSLNHTILSMTTLLHIIEDAQLLGDGKVPTSTTSRTSASSTTGSKKSRKKKIVQPTIRTTEVNFLRKALTIIRPTYAAEPFYVFGMELLCIQDLSLIYSPLLENVSDEFLSRGDVILSQNQIELIDFINVLRKSHFSKFKKHFLSKFISSIFSTESREFSESYLDLREEHISKNELIRDFCTYMEMFIETEDFCSETFNEMDLSKFLLLVLNDATYITKNNTRFIAAYCKTQPLKQYRHAKYAATLGQKNTPDLRLVEKSDVGQFRRLRKESSVAIMKVLKIVILELKSPAPSNNHKWKPPMKSQHSARDGSIELVTFDTTLLWQVQEQLVATMMNRDYSDVQNGDIVFQGNVVVCNDKIRSVILAVDGKCYNGMKKNISAYETLQWIKNYVLEEKKMWARIYIDANEYDILNVSLQARFTLLNFCGVKKTSNN